MELTDQRRAARLYVKGWSPIEIASRLNFTASEVREALRDYGFRIS